jgi:hypothetical protein
METENHTLMEKQMIDIKKIIKEEGHIRKLSRTTIKDLNKKNFDNT